MTLLRAADRFVTVGPWAGLEAIGARRALTGWRGRAAAIREFLADCRPFTLEMMVERV